MSKLSEHITREVVVKQFFWDLLENLGEDYESDIEYSSYDKEESNFILMDLFFAGLLKIGWNPKDWFSDFGNPRRATTTI
jgi:hypothetical protein